MASIRRYSTLINKIINLKKFDNPDKFDSVCTRIYILKLNKDDDELIIESLDSKIYLKNLELVKVEKELINNNTSTSCNNGNYCCKFHCCKSLDN